MKHLPVPAANALVVTVAVIYIVCALSVLLFPDLAMTVARSWFHGIDISTIALANVTPGSLVLGFITSTGGAWIVGYLHATVYNSFAKK